MIARKRRALRAVMTLLAASTVSTALAHSASDAYLTLEVQAGGQSAKSVFRAQWDVALRDLDFVLRLDENGDGSITWRELRSRQPAIAAYAYRFLHASGDGKACAVRPIGQMVDQHADGTYAVLTFEIECTGTPKRLTLDYRMFFAVDPSHRCILVFRNGGNTATALLSPDSAQVDFRL